MESIPISETWIAFCGHYCGSCHLYRGEIADLAKELLRRLKDAQFQKTAEGVHEFSGRFRDLADYRRFSDALCELDSLRCTRICRLSDASKNCRVRRCCEHQEIAGCWECETIESCAVLNGLNPDLRQHRIALFSEIRHMGVREYLSQAHRRAIEESAMRILPPNQTCPSE